MQEEITHSSNYWMGVGRNKGVSDSIKLQLEHSTPDPKEKKRKKRKDQKIVMRKGVDCHENKFKMCIIHVGIQAYKYSPTNQFLKFKDGTLRP